MQAFFAFCVFCCVRKLCSQLMRLKQKGLRLTICVEEVAASGGYMMACTAGQGRPYHAPHPKSPAGSEVGGLGWNPQP